MVDIQVQFSIGEWRTVSQVRNDPQFILQGMQAAARTHKDKRIRASLNGRVIDIL